MPTIAEIIAARSKAATADPKPDVPKESIAETAVATAAIDRIDPPGKRKAAAASRKATGMILSRDLPPTSPNGEARGQKTPITGPPEDRRSLSETEGEGIPVVPVESCDSERLWHAAMSGFETDLCLMTDPLDPERGWIAVRLEGMEQSPILLKSFPLYQHPRTSRPPNAPF